MNQSMDIGQQTNNQRRVRVLLSDNTCICVLELLNGYDCDIIIRHHERDTEHYDDVITYSTKCCCIHSQHKSVGSCSLSGMSCRCANRDRHQMLDSIDNSRKSRTADEFSV
jgi:hypothetical protein